VCVCVRACVHVRVCVSKSAIALYLIVIKNTCLNTQYRTKFFNGQILSICLSVVRRSASAQSSRLAKSGDDVSVTRHILLF
jgi:hypothetical protein